MDPKHLVPELNIVVSNSCNFNCENCNRMSNYNFTGHYNWEQSKDELAKWSERIDTHKWTLIGGEPTITPSFRQWLRGVHTLWPNAEGILLTNGSLLKTDDEELYTILQQSNGKVTIEVGLHNSNRRQEMLDFTFAFLKGNIYAYNYNDYVDTFLDSYKLIRANEWPECNSVEDWDSLPDEVKTECEQVYNFNPELLRKEQIETLVDKEVMTFEDSNGVKIAIHVANHFFKSAAIPDVATQTFTLHNSDPVVAHKLCAERRGNVGQITARNMYKCSTIQMLPEFDKQFTINMSDADRELLHSYKPATNDMTDEQLQQWVLDSQRPIPQCKFCTDDYSLSEIFAEPKKVFFVKKPKSKQ